MLKSFFLALPLLALFGLVAAQKISIIPSPHILLKKRGLLRLRPKQPLLLKPKMK